MSDNMWTLTVRTPGGVPQEYILKKGRNTIGRKPDNDIVVPDVSASRLHAVIHYDDETETVMIYDMGSTNGTFVNREKLSRPHRIESGDIIRIGGSVIHVGFRSANDYSMGFLGTRKLTRELLLESLDQNAVLMYEVAHQLNTILDVENALDKVSSLMKQAMGADKGDVILAKDFHRISELGFPESIAKSTIEKRSATVIPDLVTSELGKKSDSASLLRVRSALCVPIISGDEIIGLIYMYKTNPDSRPFDQRDLELAVAISHQAALTIQRAELIERVKKEESARNLFLRIMPPMEADLSLEKFIKSGSLPSLQFANGVVLVVEIENISNLIQRLPPETLGELLDCFYRDITDVVFEWGGMVKQVGDGVVAMFGLSSTNKDRPAERAVRAARGLLDKLKITQSYFGESFNVGIGIQTGQVCYGFVGADERAEFVVFGEPLSVAFKLQELARPNLIYIAQEVVNEIESVFILKPLGDMIVQDLSKPVQVYQVLDENTPWVDEDETAATETS